MQLQRLLDLSEITDKESFRSELIELAAELDFGLVMCMVVVEVPGGPAQVERLSNTPEAFLQASVDSKDSARDPVLQRLKTLSVPVIYDQSTYVQEDAADLWEAQAQYGYRTGISIPLHLPGNRHFVLGVNRDKPLPKSDAELVRLLGDLQLITVHAQQAALKLLAQPATKVSLTPREQLVLRMASEGKSTKVIARELACSYYTVNFHFQNVREKLNVTSRHQAARHALALGLL